jgi:hypothetical protein
MAKFISVTAAAIFFAAIYLKVAKWRANYRRAQTAGFSTYYSP